MADEDFNLIERFQHGDVEAFELLVSKYQGKVYDIAYHHTHNAEDAYDLSQEIFERVFKSVGRFRKKSSFYTWLYRVAVNACVDFARKKSRSQVVPIEEWVCSHESQVAGPGYSPAEVVELQELRHQIAKAIDQLPPRQRTVFILKRQEGLSLAEIAGILNRSEGTIKAHLFHATHKLMNMLAPYLENQ